MLVTNEEVAGPEGHPIANAWLRPQCEAWLARRRLNTKKSNEEWTLRKQFRFELHVAALDLGSK